MDDSILVTIKKLLGLDANYTPFDTDIIVFINGAMMVLQQLGVGPDTGYTITDSSQTWTEFLPSDVMLEAVKHYIFLYVRMVFDPPTSSVVMEAMNKQRAELEWRLREQVEFYKDSESQDSQTDGSTDSSGGSESFTATSGFRLHGGRYESDPDYPWKDGPAQPAVVDGDP